MNSFERPLGEEPDHRPFVARGDGEIFFNDKKLARPNKDPGGLVMRGDGNYYLDGKKVDLGAAARSAERKEPGADTKPAKEEQVH